MTIGELAEKYKLRVKKLKDGEEICPGKFGHLYIYDDQEENLVGAMFITDEIHGGWTARRKQLVAAGATVVQNGDHEGAVSIPADCAKAVRKAITLLKIYRSRTVDPETMAKRLEGLKKARKAKFSEKR